MPKPLSTLEMYEAMVKNGGKPQRKCKSCNSKTGYYCATCSNPESGDIMCYCYTGKRGETKECMKNH